MMLVPKRAAGAADGFVRLCAAVAAVMALGNVQAGAATSAPADTAAAADAAVRLEMPLATGWHFKRAAGLSGVEAPQFDDTGWDPVTVPHTWNRIGNEGYERSTE